MESVLDRGDVLKEFGTAIILAGGKSSRMGFDKQFLMIREKRLMESMIDKLNKEFNEFIVVTNKPEYYVDFPHKLVTDKIVGQGPLSGIHAGLSEADSKYSFVIACDMPNINLDYIRYMKESIKNTDYDGCITYSKDWIEPFSSFYSKEILQDLEKSLLAGQKMIYPFIKEHNFYYVDEDIARKFTPDWDIFINLNTQEELEYYKNNIENK